MNDRKVVAEGGPQVMYLVVLHELHGAELFVNPDHIVKCHLNNEGTRIVLSSGEGHLVIESPDEVNRVCSNTRHGLQTASDTSSFGSNEFQQAQHLKAPLNSRSPQIAPKRECDHKLVVSRRGLWRFHL